MKKSLSFLILASLALQPLIGWAAAPKVVITVSLSKNMVTIEKITKTGKRRLLAPMVPVAHGSLHTGTFRPNQLAPRYRLHNGTGILQNVVRFGRDSTIRTSRMFDGWVGSGRPTTHSVVLEPATGKILFDTVKAYGLSQTVIRVVR